MSKKKFCRILAFLLAVGFVQGCKRSPEGSMADLVLLNGKVWTGDPGRPWAEAVAVRGDTIFVVGKTAEIRELAPAGTESVDLGGALVLPGFIDSHTHFLAGGFALKSIQLRAARSREEFVGLIAAKARALGKGRWIVHGDWDPQEFRPPELPTKDLIDAVTPDNPVCVNRLDGHMVLANSVAQKLAGVTKDTPVPPGGEIVKDPATGEL
ncbi:MAG: amidohydrolase family protein, partial [Candidatus Aminicenantes bacterium]|nr:amidohydrolase family protein [Candidatus Aminicenantes bacterium]